jgi:hypothetical protein
MAPRVYDFDSAAAVIILSRHSGLKVRLSRPVTPRTGKKIPPTFGAEGLEFDDLCRTVDRLDGASMFDSLAFEATRRTVIVVRIKFAALLSGHLPTELLSNSSSDIVTELFDLSKAGRLQIDVPAVDSLGDQFLCEPIDQSIKRGRIL